MIQIAPVRTASIRDKFQVRFRVFRTKKFFAEILSEDTIEKGPRWVKVVGVEGLNSPIYQRVFSGSKWPMWLKWPTKGET